MEVIKRVFISVGECGFLATSLDDYFWSENKKHALSQTEFSDGGGEREINALLSDRTSDKP